MESCSMTVSEASKNWPEGTISARITINPYVFAMAFDEAFKQEMKTWEFICSAIWEKLGKPDHKTLLQYAANLELDDEDPKWKKRLKITARHEIETAAALMERRDRDSQADADTAGRNGEPS